MSRRRRWVGLVVALALSGGVCVGAGALGQQLVAADAPGSSPLSPTPGDLSHRAASATDHRVIGRSVQGREIVATAYGDRGARRVLLLIGLMHGSERGGLGVVDRVAAAGAVPGTRIWIIRAANPDGLAARKRANARGVDINRNAPHRWRRGPRGVYYPGPNAASEPETQAYMSFLSDVRPDLILSFHQDLNGVDSYGNKDRALIKQLGREFRLPVKSFACTGVCRGTLTGWFNANHVGSAVTIELPGRVTKRQAARWAASVGRIAAAMRDVG